MRNALPSLPAATAQYDVANEQAFRQTVESLLAELTRYIEPPPSVGSPDALSAGSNNDVSFGSRTILRLTPNASGSTITGIANGRDGKRLEIVNLGSADLTLAHQNASSIAENRLLSATGVDVVLRADQKANATYDATTARWRVAASDTRTVGIKSATLGAGNTNDYDAESSTRLLRITADLANSTITGILGGAQVREITVVNVSTFTLTLAHESASSSAANRISSPSGADVNLFANDCATLMYDSTSARWRIIALNT